MSAANMFTIFLLVSSVRDLFRLDSFIMRFRPGFWVRTDSTNFRQRTKQFSMLKIHHINTTIVLWCLCVNSYLLGFCVQPLPFMRRTLRRMVVQIAQEMISQRLILLTMIGEADGVENIDHKELACPLNTGK